MHLHMDTSLHYTPPESTSGDASAMLSLKQAVCIPTPSPGHATALRHPTLVPWHASDQRPTISTPGHASAKLLLNAFEIGLYVVELALEKV